MAGWDGNGNFLKTHSWVADQGNGIKILATRHDANDDDFTSGINNCLTIDGQNIATANLPMGTFKHIGTALATNATDYLRADQVQSNNLTHYTATGTDTYAITPSPAITAYAAGQKFSVLFTNANTGAATLNANALGTQAIEDQNGNALAAGAIGAGAVVDCVYDGTNFQIIPTVLPTTSFADNSVGLAQMAGGTDGNLITYDTNGDPAFVVTGTAGQVLESNGAGAAPSFKTRASNDPLLGVLNGEMTLTSASATSTFTAHENVLGTALGTVTDKVSSYSQALDLTGTGAGGMDTGTAPVSGYISIYAITKADGTTDIFACAEATSSGEFYSGGNIPTDFLNSKLLTIWPTDGSSLMVIGYGRDRHVERTKVVIENNLTPQLAALTTLSISSAVPVIAKTASGQFGTNFSSAVAVAMQVASDSSGNIAFNFGSPTSSTLITGATQARMAFKDIPLVTAQTIFRAHGGAATSNTNFFWIDGYRF